jgi:hypothetical protein
MQVPAQATALFFPGSHDLLAGFLEIGIQLAGVDGRSRLPGDILQ